MFKHYSKLKWLDIDNKNSILVEDNEFMQTEILKLEYNRYGWGVRFCLVDSQSTGTHISSCDYLDERGRAKKEAIKIAIRKSKDSIKSFNNLITKLNEIE